MVLDNALERHGYAVLLLCAYHSDELSLNTAGCRNYTRITHLWSYDTQHVYEALTIRRDKPIAHGSPEMEQWEANYSAAFDMVFPGLRDKMCAGKPNTGDYNDVPESMHDMNLFYVQAHGEDLLRIWYNMQEEMRLGPQGGDDTTYDYWPSAFSLWVHMGHDLKELGFHETIDGEDIDRCMSRTWGMAAEASTFSPSEFAAEVQPHPIEGVTV